MQKIRKTAFVACIVIATLFTVRVYGQSGTRMQFPPGPIGTPPASPAIGGTPSAAFGGGITKPIAPPSLPASAFDPYQLPGTPQTYGNPTIYGTPPAAPGAFGAYPTTNPQLSPDPRFSQGPSSVYPNGSPFPNGQYMFNTPGGGVGQWTRFLQGVSIEYTWLYGQASDELGVNDVDLSATFAIPIFPNRDYPLLVSPGFGAHWWDGPAAAASVTATDTADLPPVAYDAYLDFTWRPKLSEVISTELAFRPGVYSDFSSVNRDSIRLQGRALIYITVTPTMQLVGGVVYLDRLDIKLLPAGGVIWTPNPKARYEIVFPKPKLARYWFTSGSNTEWWWYATAEYGGGSWTIQRAVSNTMQPGIEDRIDLNDIRVGGGLEFRPTKSLDGVPRAFGRNYVGYVEAAYVFNREILYKSWRPRAFDISDTIMVRAGIRF